MSHPHPELGQPPELPEGALRVTPLGGLGEIGRNMTVFEYAGKLLIVDCGVLFPEPEQPGVDLILPDFTSIRDRYDDVVAVVLTHGHEDHIGAVPYLLRERPDIPLVGSQLTLALIEAKLAEHRIRPYTLEVKEGQTERIGPFDCSFLAVNHSIPDALAVVIKTEAGTVLHTGDFKMDQLPLDGRLTDLAGIARLGERGHRPGAGGLDQRRGARLRRQRAGDHARARARLRAAAQRRVIVASFASHVHRIQQVLDIAVEEPPQGGLHRPLDGAQHGRRARPGLPQGPGRLGRRRKRHRRLPPEQVVLICTGSQGEPMAALSRMASRDHQIRIVEDDTVVLASSLIPGNETAVYRVINGLTRWGANVVHKGNAKVHVSGPRVGRRAAYFYNLARPRTSCRSTASGATCRRERELARLTGVPAERIVIAEDGVAVDLINGTARISGKVPCGYVYVDGLSVGDVTEASLKDRRILGDEGFISVFVVVDADTGKVAAGPEVQSRGAGIDDSALAAVIPLIEEGLAHAAADGVGDAYQLQQLVRRIVGKWVSDTFRRRPMIIPVVVEV